MALDIVEEEVAIERQMKIFFAKGPLDYYLLR